MLAYGSARGKLMLLRLSGFDLPMSALPGSATCCGKS